MTCTFVPTSLNLSLLSANYLQVIGIFTQRQIHIIIKSNPQNVSPSVESFAKLSTIPLKETYRDRASYGTRKREGKKVSAQLMKSMNPPRGNDRQDV